MLFHSWDFIGIFLPVTFLGFFLCGYFKNRTASLLWLVCVSLLFYGWWNPNYVVLILCSIGCNFYVSVLLQRVITTKKIVLWIGIAANLILLGYYKYANFFIDTVNSITDANFHITTIILPLGISFFTFQQIAYLVDVYKEKVEEHNFVHYALFVLFFPQLIAGPIVHHADVLPQFTKKDAFALRADHIAIGLSIFIIGLCKKVILADSLSQFSSQVFSAVDAGVVPTMFEAWIGVLSYTLQLYFDFSGYSDMAIGIARMFGILLPVNFYSPYKSTSCIEFWRRWHITLSAFLRDYLYIPLGGNRKGLMRQIRNVTITMLLGGLWHGAGWTFVFWGALHGVYLSINHLWRRIVPLTQTISLWRSFFAWFITFLAVVISWVFFRAKSFSTALILLRSMFSIPTVQTGFIIDIYTWKIASLMVAACLCIALFLPNTHQYMQYDVKKFYTWSPTTTHAIGIALMALAAIVCMVFSQESEFLYFQF